MIDTEIRSKILEFGAKAVDVFSGSHPNALGPREITDIQTVLAGYAAQIEEEYAKYEMLEPLWKSGIKEGSEAERNRAWLSSEEGQRQIKLKYILKSVDRVIAACKKRMDRFNNEAYNRY